MKKKYVKNNPFLSFEDSTYRSLFIKNILNLFIKNILNLFIKNFYLFSLNKSNKLLVVDKLKLVHYNFFLDLLINI